MLANHSRAMHRASKVWGAFRLVPCHTMLAPPVAGDLGSRHHLRCVRNYYLPGVAASSRAAGNPSCRSGDAMRLGPARGPTGGTHKIRSHAKPGMRAVTPGGLVLFSGLEHSGSIAVGRRCRTTSKTRFERAMLLAVRSAMCHNAASTVPHVYGSAREQVMDEELSESVGLPPFSPPISPATADSWVKTRTRRSATSRAIRL